MRPGSTAPKQDTFKRKWFARVLSHLWRIEPIETYHLFAGMHISSEQYLYVVLYGKGVGGYTINDS